MERDTKSKEAHLSPMSKMMIGAVGIIVVAMMLPLIDMFETMLTIILIPLIVLVCAGFISVGTYEFYREITVGKVGNDLRERLNHWREHLTDEDDVIQGT